ncbi:hypothetical protein Trydic_g17666 [Trypoxylus dichotomus]
MREINIVRSSEACTNFPRGFTALRRYASLCYNNDNSTNVTRLCRGVRRYNAEGVRIKNKSKTPRTEASSLTTLPMAWKRGDTISSESRRQHSGESTRQAPSEESQEPSPTSSNNQMHNTNGKIVRALAGSLNDNRTTTGELNGNNIIFLRGGKSTDNGHLLLRADTLNSSTKTNLVLDDGEGKLSQIFIQQSDLTEGVLLQSVKRLSSGTPILLLSGNDNGNGHILIQTTTASAEEQQPNVEFTEETAGSDNILVQALEGIQDTEPTPRNASTPLGSGGKGNDRPTLY